MSSRKKQPARDSPQVVRGMFVRGMGRLYSPDLHSPDNIMRVLRCFQWSRDRRATFGMEVQIETKLQAPTSKLQRSSKPQALIGAGLSRNSGHETALSKGVTGLVGAEFGCWRLDVLWSLVLGCWCFSKPRLHRKQRRTFTASTNGAFPTVSAADQFAGCRYGILCPPSTVLLLL